MLILVAFDALAGTTGALELINHDLFSGRRHWHARLDCSRPKKKSSVAHNAL